MPHGPAAARGDAAARRAWAHRGQRFYIGSVVKLPALTIPTVPRPSMAAAKAIEDLISPHLDRLSAAVRRRPVPPGGTESAASPMRSFAPHRLGRFECDAWVAYYRRDWGRFLASSLGMVHEGFAMAWPQTVQGAYLVLRANQQWAPYPDNDAAGAQQTMTRFYALVADHHHLDLDPATAADLEIAWWRLHRDLQHDAAAGPVDALTDALAALYAYVYTVDPLRVRPAAALRAQAMAVSDQWVRQGCDGASALLVDELTALVRSYAALRTAVS